MFFQDKMSRDEQPAVCPHCQGTSLPASQRGMGMAALRPWLWMFSVLATILLTVWVMRADDARMIQSALAQTEQFGGGQVPAARSVYAFSGQLTSRTHGLFMVDVDAGTLWCYELERGENDELQLRLVAARSWIFDRYLEEYNVTKPIPSTVRMMVEQQRSHRRDADVSPDEPIGSDAVDGPVFPDENGE
jgi:hypothetical protein